MKWAVLSTWKMSLEGCAIACDLLRNKQKGDEALLSGIEVIEDNKAFVSVGFGGLPARDGRVYLDAGFMDGDTLHFGAVGALEGYRSPIRIAHSLKDREFNNFLVGEGAERYADENGFEKRDNLTTESKERWLKEKETNQNLFSYDGHDTVCFLTLDQFHTLSCGVSTSGLFLKDVGRLGDSPVIGGGFYADSKVGCAAATGVGEEIMKGALSHTAVMYMKAGMSPQQAAEKAVLDLHQELVERNGHCNSISLIAMDREGHYGIGTNVLFPFAYGSDEMPVSLYLAKKDGNHCAIESVNDINTITLD